MSLIEEAARKSPAEHVFIQGDLADKELVINPVSLYAATKKANELLAHKGIRFTLEQSDC